jgi:hypothetical protein
MAVSAEGSNGVGKGSPAIGYPGRSLGKLGRSVRGAAYPYSYDKPVAEQVFRYRRKGELN